MQITKKLKHATFIYDEEKKESVENSSQLKPLHMEKMRVDIRLELIAYN